MKIKSKSSGKEYEVNLEHLTCTCPDYKFRQAKIKGLCKHIKTVLDNSKNLIDKSLESLENNSNAIDFVEKFGEETLKVLKVRGEVYEEHGRLFKLQ